MNRVFSDQRNVYHEHIQQKKAKKKTQAERRCVSQAEKTPNKTGQANMLEKL